MILYYLPCSQVLVSQIRTERCSFWSLYRNPCYTPSLCCGRLSRTTSESSAGTLIPVRARGTSPAESDASLGTTGDQRRKSSLIEQPSQLTQYSPIRLDQYIIVSNLLVNIKWSILLVSSIFVPREASFFMI